MNRVETRRSRLLLAGLVLAHLVYISNQVDRGGSSLLQRWALAVFTPVQGAVAGALHGIASVWTSYADLRGVRRENRRLNERVGELEMQMQQRSQEAAEAHRLREVMGVRDVLPVRTVVAHVVARDGTPWYRTVTLDSGSEDGVRLDAPVLSATGVVGRVIARGPHAARVQLLLDPLSGAGARIERSRIAGVVSGQARTSSGAGGDLVMKYVPMLSDVVVGDVVVTSGLDRIFPSGLLLGRVRFVKTGAGLFKEILVTPSARFDTLEEVMVVTSPPPDDTVVERLK
uniref:Cell shape-determining protein MreC n=1 Tax=uncultured bacterium 293 TaxID=698389 RepID=E3T613_9BACT|nr:rod shape-determining protein MreC [uncultured bacterium 293]